MVIVNRIKDTFFNLASSAHLVGSDNDAPSRRGIFLSSIVYNIVIGILNGTYLSSFCLSIGADANGVNTAVLLMSFSNLIQLISPLFLERFKQRKNMLIILRGSAHGVNLLLIPVLALIGLPSPILLPISFILLGLAQCTLAFIGPGLSVWHIANIPDRTRLGYFSLFTIINCITTYVALFLSGIAMDGLIGLMGAKTAISCMRLFLILLAAADLFFLKKIKEHPVPQENFGSLLGFFKKMLYCLKERPAYGKIIAVASIWNLIANIPSQYYNTYLIENLKLSYTLLNSVTLFNLLAVTVCTPLWKKVINRKGVSGCMFWSMLLYAPHAFGFALVGKETIFLYPLSMFYNLIFAAGINLAFAMVPYIGLPEEHRGMYLALYNTSCATCALIGILLGRGIFSLLLTFGETIQIGAQSVAPARIVYAIFGVFAVAAAFIFKKLLKASESAQAEAEAAK